MTARRPQRFIGYARLSRASREESTSIERQRASIAEAVAARRGVLVDIVVDNNVSATKTRLDRPGLNEVRRRIAAGEADAVIVWRLDRIARNVGDVSNLLDEGLSIVSVTENLDASTSQGRAMIEIMQVFAKMEADATGARVSASQAYLRRNGRFPGGVVPYGYRSVPAPDGPGRVLELEPTEAAAIRQAVAAILAGRSVYAACRELNEAGVKPRRAAVWEASSLRRTLVSEHILGRVTVKGRLLRDEKGLPVVAWPPILTLDDAMTLRALLAPSPNGKRGQGRRKKATQLLSGLLRCPNCDGPMVARSRRTTGKPIYGCDAAARGRACPRGVVVMRELVDAEVERQVLAMFGPLEYVETVRSQRDPLERAEVEEAIAAIARELTAPGADIAGLSAQLAALHAERERLSAQPNEATVEYRPTGRTFADLWEEGDVHARRQLLIDTGVDIRIAPAKQRGRWDPTRVTVHLDEEADALLAIAREEAGE